VQYLKISAGFALDANTFVVRLVKVIFEEEKRLKTLASLGFSASVIIK
jgi:hypothetical protein